MPIMECTKAGKRGWKYGESGFCYVGPLAKQKAAIQGSAIKRSQKARGKHIDIADDILQNLNRGIYEFGRSTFRRKTPRWLYPISVQFEYQRHLLQLVNIMDVATREMVIPYLPNLVDEAGIKTDAWSDSVNKLLDNLRIEVNTKIIGQKSRLLDIGQKTSDWNNKEWRKVMNAVVGVQFYQREPWLNDTIESFASENVNLVKDLTEKTYNDIDGIIQRGIKSGKRHEKIRADIYGTKIKKGVFKKLRTRVKLIARDQVSKLNGQLTRLRQTGIGIKEYNWRDSRDKRVRASHLEKNGKRFSWNKPPVDTGHPGEDYQCRCWADPVFDEILEEMGILREARPTIPTRKIMLVRKIVPAKKIIFAKRVVAKVKAYESKASLKYINNTFSKRVEYAGIFNRKTGKRLWSGTNHKANTVTIPERFAKKNYVIHNHPTDASFSFSDILSASTNREIAADVVTRKYIYRMRDIKQYKVRTKTGGLRNARGLEFIDKYAKTYDGIKDKAVKKYQRLVNLGKISVKDANMKLQHETIKEFVKKTKLFTYSRVPFKPGI